MSITTSQQIGKWYDLYKSIEITYTKEIIKTTGLDPRGVFLKCVGEQWPCVIYSASFDGAKVVASSKQAFMDKVKKANNLVSLRFSFKNPDKPEPMSFFISARIAGMSPYVQSGGDLQFVNILFTQRPPDDFIEILGRVLDANINSTRRRDDRILLSPDAMRRIGLVSKDTFVFVQGVPRKCILRDLSFSGCKAIIVGIAKFLVGKECTIKVEMDEPRESLELKGVIVRYEDVEGRKDLTAIAIKFDEHAIPMTYKMHVNDFLSQVRQSRSEEPGRPSVPEGAEPPEGFKIP
ncbi:MAG TPA: PilZ domain-containing protein [Rectinemataceae bacterium]|nr:PilZ domain-containing protein [Rectinemataceae bacterium]